jgi:hypothetical protein
MSEQEVLPVADERTDVIKLEARAIIIRNVLLAAIVSFSMLCLGFLVSSSIVATQTRNAITDCVEPGGRCANRQNTETARVVQQLIDANSLDEIATRRIVVVAAICAEQREVRQRPTFSKRLKAMEACVNSQLQDEEE